MEKICILDYNNTRKQKYEQIVNKPFNYHEILNYFYFFQNYPLFPVEFPLYQR